MNKYITEQYKIETFIPLVDLTLTEDDLNDIICNTDNIAVLYISLKVKYYYVSQGIQEKLSFPIEKILRRISNCTSQDIFEMIELSIFIQDIQSVIANVIEYINKLNVTEPQDLLVQLKLLYLITNVYYSLDLTFPDYLNENLIVDLYRKVNNGHSRELQNYFCKLLVKYLKCSRSSNGILSLIISCKDLYVISCCFESFIASKSSIRTDVFWLMIGDSLQSTDYNKKLSLNIIKQYIQYINENKNYHEQSVVIKGNTKSEKEFSKIWSDYLILIDISQEKQLHLIIPALTLINKITALHFSWITCLYKLLLTHSQTTVVSIVTTYILQNLPDDIEAFEGVIEFVLPTLNKYECTDVFLAIFENFRKLGKYAHSLLNKSLNISWSPVPAWYFYSNALCDIIDHNIGFELIINVINHIKKLPHTFIRASCIIVLLKFLVRQENFTNLNLKQFLKIAHDLKQSDKTILTTFFEFSTKNIELYNRNGSVEEEISKINRYCTTDIPQIVLEISNYNRKILELLKKHLESHKVIETEIADYIMLYICKNDLKEVDIINYFLVKLQVIDYNGNTEGLCEIVNYITGKDTKICDLLKELKIILFNPGKYEENKLCLAFKIYSKNVLEDDVENVIKFWNNKLLSGDRISISVWKLYLETYFTYLKSGNIPENIFEIIASTFETQSEDIWLVMYENFHILTQSIRKEDILYRIFEKFTNEISKFKCVDNQLRAWSIFIKIIFNNTSVFTLKDIRDLLLVEIPQISMINDWTACICAGELAKLDEKNVLLFRNLIVQFILYGGVYKKDKRCEYYACRDIDFKFGMVNKNNPIYLQNNIRCSALNVLSCILNNNGEDIADSMVELFLYEYYKYFKKRYFPESEIHLSKLRIIQALLVLAPHISGDIKDLIITFIIDSFCEENHQPCVRQLLQCLFIVLLDDNHDRYLEKISERMNITSRSHISTIAAFVPILCHMGYTADEEFIEKLIKIMLEWTMGAHFKLRLYSQVGITSLIKTATQKEYTRIVSKYDGLCKSVKEVLNMAGGNVQNTLQNDSFLLEEFNTEKYYNFKVIYIDIPRLNKVPESEWRYIDLNLFSNSVKIPIECGSIDEKYFITEKINIPNDSALNDTISNIQKKIVPHKNPLDLIDNVENPKLTELILVTSLVESVANLGGLSRTSEIYGVKEMIVADGKIIGDKGFKSLSMSSENWVDIFEVKFDDLPDYLERAKRDGYLVVGAEQTAESVELQKFDFPKKCVLVLGNEKQGIPAKILPYLDHCVEIPQYGVVRSLNVHVAAAIIIWEYIKQNVLS